MERNYQLDGLRGYAALAVVVFHTILATDHTLVQRVLGPAFRDVPVGDWATKLALSVFNGETAVSIFFVLSGTVLFDSLRRQPGPSGFVIRRAFRIFPALFAAVLAGTAVLASRGEASSFSGVVENLFLLDTSIIGPAWTLQVEILAVPFILLGFWSFRRFGLIGLAGAFAIAFLVAGSPEVRSINSSLKPNLLCFAFGFVITTPLGAAVGRRLSAGWCAVALGTILLGRHLVPSANTSLYMLQAGAALVVCSLYHGRAGRIGRFLGRPEARGLGRISYSLYLLNVPILIASGPLVGDPLLVGLPTGLAIAAATVPLAIAAERWVERPMIRIGNRIAKWQAAAPFFLHGPQTPAAVREGS